MHASGHRNRRLWLGYVPSVPTRFFLPSYPTSSLWQTHFDYWYRNLIGFDQFSIQGYRRHRIRPDFVVQNTYEQRSFHRVLVIESKGKHLEGNRDTDYKRSIAEIFDQVGQEVTWQQLGEDFKDHIFRFQILDESAELGRDWQDVLTEVLKADA